MEPNVLWQWAIMGLGGIVNLLIRMSESGVPIEHGAFSDLEQRVSRLEQLIVTLKTKNGF